MSSICFCVLTNSFLGTLQPVSYLSSLPFSLLTCFVLLVLVESNVFFFLFPFLGIFLFFFSEIQLILDKLTSFHSDVLSSFFRPILILLMGV